jgi:hypothetical protein
MQIEFLVRVLTEPDMTDKKIRVANDKFADYIEDDFAEKYQCEIETNHGGLDIYFSFFDLDLAKGGLNRLLKIEKSKAGQLLKLDVMRFNGKASVDESPMTFITVQLRDDFDRNAPLLKYVGYHVDCLVDDMQIVKVIDSIFEKFINTPNLKKAIWQCQQELIDAGYEGNARY